MEASVRQGRGRAVCSLSAGLRGSGEPCRARRRALAALPLPGRALGGHGGERAGPPAARKVGKVPALSPNFPSVLISPAEDGDAVSLKGRSAVSPALFWGRGGS